MDNFIAQHDVLSWTLPRAGSVGFVHWEDGAVDRLMESLESRDTLVAPARFFGVPDAFVSATGRRRAILDEGLARLADALEESRPAR